LTGVYGTKKPFMSETPQESYDLTLEELRNIDKTVEKYRAQVLCEVRANHAAKATEATLRKLKKAYKLQQEENFNRQFLR
jgi:hypothetical protein